MLCFSLFRQMKENCKWLLIKRHKHKHLLPPTQTHTYEYIHIYTHSRIPCWGGNEIAAKLRPTTVPQFSFKRSQLLVSFCLLVASEDINKPEWWQEGRGSCKATLDTHSHTYTHPHARQQGQGNMAACVARLFINRQAARPRFRETQRRNKGDKI